MKKSTYIYYIFTYLSLNAQNTLKGTVLHIENKEPIIGASVFLIELNKITSTDLEGNFLFSDLKKGNITLEIKYVGHKTIIDKIDIDSSKSLNYLMENSAQSLDEVIISGASSRTIIKESPLAISTYSQLQWLQGSSTNLTDAISKQPGMSQVTTGSQLSKPIIRGLGFNRVITMHDGVRQEDNQWGEEHAIQVDEYSIDRYEIIRGAGSLMYGSDGLGGVMSLFSPRIIENGKIQAKMLLNYQSNNSLRGVSGVVAGNQNGLVWRLRISHKNANNYQNKYDGRVFGSNFNEHNINGMLGIQRKWGYSHIYFSNFNNKVNIIDGARDSLGRFTIQKINKDNIVTNKTLSEDELSTREINPSSSQNLTNQKLSWNNFVYLGKTTLQFVGSYAENHRKEYGDIFNPNIPTLYFYLQTVYYDAKWNIPFRKNTEITIGSNGMIQNLTNKGNEVLYPNYSLRDNGVFLFAKQKLNRFHISGGIRADSRTLTIDKLYIDSFGKFQSQDSENSTIRFSGFNRDFNNFTSSLGFVYFLTEKLLLKSNIARGFRAPTVPEIASNGEHSGTFRYEYGNINHKSETSFQTDAGITYENKNFYFDANFFQNSISNYSYSQKLLSNFGGDSIVDLSNPVPTFKYVQGNAILYGTEAVATISPEKARWISFMQNFSLVKALNLSSNSDSTRYLPFIPAARWLSQLKFSRDKTGKLFKNSYASFELEVNHTQNDFLKAYQTETSTPAYALINFGFGTEIVVNKKYNMLSVFVSVNNLLDEAFQNHQSRLKYLDINPNTGRRGVFNMGRNLSIKLVLTGLLSN